MCARDPLLNGQTFFFNIHLLLVMVWQLEKSNQMPIHMDDEETLRIIHEQGKSLLAPLTSAYTHVHISCRFFLSPSTLDPVQFFLGK